MNEWLAVDITVERRASEAVESAFNRFDCLGTEINDLRNGPSPTVCVTGYFSGSISRPEILDTAADELFIHGFESGVITSIEFRTIEKQDWLAEWKKYWRPTEIGKFVIAPPWSDIESDKIIIRIEPNMAFGTGTHETTQLCLKAIGENYSPDFSMLDVGTGTGILAIAAAKLGGRHIFACDTDVDSVTIARENAVLNDVTSQIQFAAGPIDNQTPQFDLVCANLTLDVIQPILGLLLDKTKNWLLLSGILAVQETDIRDELSKFQISKFNLEISGEWISVLINKV